MDVKVGCDLVHIGRLKESMERGGEKFLNRVFTRAELAGASKPENLAGIFAAKEAVVKALGLKAGEWHKIEIGKSRNGHPMVRFLKLNKKIASQDVSISHAGEYAIAITVFIIK